jgi:hypothetical protein
MSERDTWDGRPVTFANLSILEGDPIMDAFGRGDGKAARYALLVASVRWADTGDAVFTSVEQIHAQPLRAWVALMRLAAKAMFANGLTDDDPDAPRAALTNGHAQPGPSL